jgi:hypothetical protein
MNRRDKQTRVFKQLVDRQLLPFGKTYEDVISDPMWYLRYKTTPEAEKEFIQWGVEFLRKELSMTKKGAENEMSWFVLQWGLTTNQELNVEDFIAQPADKVAKAS